MRRPHPGKRRKTSALPLQRKLVCSRQEDSEQASALLVACELNSPAVRLDRPASDRKTKSDAAFFPGAASVHPIEAIEDTIPMRCGNPRAAVSYLDYRLAQARRIRLDADGAAIWGVFDRIVDHVREGMAHERGVAHGTNRNRGLQRELLLFFVGQHTELIDDISRQRSEVQGLLRQVNFSRVGARKGQKALDQPRESVDLLEHAADD